MNIIRIFLEETSKSVVQARLNDVLDSDTLEPHIDVPTCWWERFDSVGRNNTNYKCHDFRILYCYCDLKLRM